MFRKGLWLWSSVLLLSACKTTQTPTPTTTPAVQPPVAAIAPPPAQQEPVVMTVGGKPVVASEFLQVYRKNLLANDSTNAEKSLRDYVELYVNFKLKVIAAEQLGLDTTEAFREELATYRKQLAQPYLTEKNVSEALVKEAYERMKEEVNASHILIACAPEAEPQDTLAAYREAMQLRERAMAGEDFGQLAKQYSKDPSAAYNEGNLKYFTALQMVYPFENAAFQTAKGKISMPVRTQYGYHIIKVLDRRESLGKRRVAHILTYVKPRATPEETVASKQKIDEIFARLKKGESFEKLCREFSEDESTRSNNGELRVFGTGEFDEAFEESAYALQEIGEISSPFQTRYGWHIIKLLEKRSIEPFGEMANFIREKIMKDSRSDLGKAALVKRLKKENSFGENPVVVQEAVAQGDTSLFRRTWSYNQQTALANKTILTIGRKAVQAGDFLAFVKSQQTQPEAINWQGSAPVLMRNLYHQFADKQIVAYEEDQLEAKYPEFRALLKEYRDGILLFQMMESNVWQKSVQDTTGLATFFAQHRAKYTMPERAYASYLSADTKETLEEAQKTLSERPYPLTRKLNDLLFDKNQSVLTPEHKEKLFDLIVILSKNPEYRVEIMGNTDPTERDTVSASRAHNVVKYLLDNRISINRIVEKDNGKYKPVSRTERNRNQRVAFGFSTNSRSDVEKQFNATKPDRLSVLEGYFRKGDNKIMDSVEWKVGVQAFEKSNRYYHLDIKKIDAPRPKSLDEARGAVINDYQAFLEKEWLNRLKQTFSVSVNDDEIKKLVK
jgi:peptidyl-prolyl cis-trans isomerase SurA